MNMTQCEKIVKIMLNNDKRVWSAKDFQREPWFIGYEASARISDLIRMYPDAFIKGKEGRFRTLELNYENEEAIEELVNLVKGEDDERRN